MMNGLVVTFYSYKGGVGRSFALANAAVILAQWGLKVLSVDWDIEAPGLSHYFGQFISNSSLGVVDFLTDCRNETLKPWGKYTQIVDIPDCRGTLALMPAAAAGGNDYARIVQELNWDTLYTEHNLGSHLEEMRADWIKAFDIVLIDSRTGITDFSGITTVQLPDVLVFFFTANHQSLHGCCDVVRRAINARKLLPIDRPALLALPVPAKFELREEYDRANAWRSEFASTLEEFFRVWAPMQIETSRLVDNLIIPYVPRWSFGEDLAALSEPSASNGTRTASFPVSFSIETLASMLANRLGKVDLFSVSRDEFVLTAKAGALDQMNSRGESRPKVFISYRHSSQEIKIANILINELEKCGLSTWHDVRIEGGIAFQREVAEDLAQSDAIVLIVGETVSHWQRAEVEAFIRSGLRGASERPILPIILPGAKNSLKEFRFLSTTNFVEIDGQAPLEPQVSSVAVRLLEILDPEASESAIRTRRKQVSAIVDEGDTFFERGMLLDAATIYRRALDQAETLARQYSGNPELLHDVGSLQNKIGDVARSQGDVSAALASYRAGMEIAERISSSTELLHGYDKIGDMYLQRGDLIDALASYRSAIKIAESLGSPLSQSTIYYKIGEVLVLQGDLSGALKSYVSGLVIAEHLDEQRIMLVGHNKIGDVLSAQGDLLAALKSYKTAIAIVERLSSENPENVELQRYLAVIQANIGDVARARGDIQAALNWYYSCVAVIDRLAMADPDNAAWQREFAVAKANIGDLLRAQGDLKGALENYRESLSREDRLARTDPGNTVWLRDLSFLHNKIGDVLRSRGEIKDAAEHYQNAHSIIENIANSDPRNAFWQRDLARSYLQIALIDSDLGDRAKAVGEARRGREILRRLTKILPDDTSTARELASFDEVIAELEK